MLSLIICSRQSDISQSLKDNIQSTIGVEYELVIIDNSKNEYSMFTAYNKGVREAKGNIFCFMHEDIKYLTKDWGKNVICHFNNAETGLVGVMGGHYLPDLVCHIGDSGILSYHYYYICKDGSRIYNYSPSHFPSGTSEVDVVAVDGLWFAIPRVLFQKISFDERYGGFHYYDMDISMQIWAAGFKCKVINDVVISHYSAGRINHDFIKSSYCFYTKWKSFLPMIQGLSVDESLLQMSKELCRYKRYCRELEWELRKKKVQKCSFLIQGKRLLKKLMSQKGITQQ